MEFYIKIIDKTVNNINMVKKLYREVFEDDERFTEYYFSNVVSENTTVIMGGFIENELVTIMFLRERQLLYGVSQLEGCYIYGVATKIEYRGHGYMGRLMRSALKYCNEKAYDVVYLIPVDENIYRAFGFKSVNKAEKKYIFSDEGNLETINEGRLEAAEFLLPKSIVKVKADDMNTIREISSFAIKNEQAKGRLVIKKSPVYFKNRVLQADAENAGVYIIKDSTMDKNIKAVVITGTDDSEKICIKTVICDMKDEAELLRAFVKQYPNVNPYIRKYPVMVYEPDEKGNKADINDEV